MHTDEDNLLGCQDDELNSIYLKAPLKDRKKKQRKTCKQVVSLHFKFSDTIFFPLIISPAEKETGKNPPYTYILPFSQLWDSYYCIIHYILLIK